MEPRTHSFFSSVNSRGRDNGVTIHCKGRSKLVLATASQLISKWYTEECLITIKIFFVISVYIHLYEPAFFCLDCFYPIAYKP